MTRRRAAWKDDPESSFRRADPEALDLGPLFEHAVAAWPEAPAVTEAEQRGLELPESNEAKYRAWRDTNDGTAAFRWVANHALGEVARGATRLFIDRIWWTAREALGQSLNNTYRALLVRELVDTYPALKDVFEIRQRRAS